MSAVVRSLGQVDYVASLAAMREFVAARGVDTTDEIWLLEHPPVFTLGLAAKREHLLAPGTIPVLASDRGGQVTYHGPGQTVAYVLLDLKRLGLGPRELVRRLEEAVIETLHAVGITGARRPGAPGVYVDGAKIASLGLRVRGGYTYHGIALNVAMDLEPFSRINPCGYAGLAVTSLERLGCTATQPTVEATLSRMLLRHLYPPGARAALSADNGAQLHSTSQPI